ncbi:DUF1772 domain-containing protein [Saxibacter everestensis]|uniref:DUF1772 domain-containing protein n=1 Tax=Saxibacter everestensis TaxID=2909229 RepID=A0ABY8QTH4_9MICO|nr:DUF1772 domain-containing protein [Brevibacteriaceae bacterium ZFBP1038]
MVTVVAALVVVVVGLMVGVELAVALFVNPICGRLSRDAAVAARVDGARALGRVMPFWYGGSVAIAALWMMLIWGQSQMRMVLPAVGLLVISVLMSIILLVPINSRVASWSAGAIPADWKQQVRRWDRLHYARVVIVVIAFVLLTLAGVVG